MYQKSEKNIGFMSGIVLFHYVGGIFYTVHKASHIFNYTVLISLPAMVLITAIFPYYYQ